MILMCLFYCCKKVFTHMNKWMIGKKSMKSNYLKKKIFTVAYVQSITFLLSDVSENFRNIYLETYELDPACFFTSTGLAWQTTLKKD